MMHGKGNSPSFAGLLGGLGLLGGSGLRIRCALRGCLPGEVTE